MKKQKEQWKPEIINTMADGTVVKDLTGYVIPAGHTAYDVLRGVITRKLEKGA